MSAPLPGSKHSTTLDRRERAILHAIQRTRGVRKLETYRMEWTGPTSHKRLELRPTPWATATKDNIEGWLFLASGKRQLMITPEASLTLDAVCQILASTLHKFKVVVEVRGDTVPKPPTLSAQAEQREHINHHMVGDPTMEQHATESPECLVWTTEATWPHCEAIYEGVQRVKALEEQELELQIQLEELRSRKQALQAQTLETLARVIRAGRRAA